MKHVSGHSRLLKPKSRFPVCGCCGNSLQGVSRKMFAVAKTKRVPSRPFGGTLCTGCMRRRFVEEARAR